MPGNVLLVTAVVVTVMVASLAHPSCLFRCSHFKPAKIFECLSGPVLEECHTDVVPGGAVCWGVNRNSRSPVSGAITRWLRVEPRVLAPVVGSEVAALLDSLWREDAQAAALARPGLAPGEFSGSVAVADRSWAVSLFPRTSNSPPGSQGRGPDGGPCCFPRLQTGFFWRAVLYRPAVCTHTASPVTLSITEAYARKAPPGVGVESRT